jgi:hypothetical protein
MAAKEAGKATGDPAKSASVPEAVPFPSHPTIENGVGNPSPPEQHAGLWRSMFGWGSIFRWDVLGALVPGVFIAVGLGMLGIEWFPRNLLISQVCFSVAAIMVMTKAIGHAYKAAGTLSRKIVFCVVLCGITLGMAIFTVLSIQAHKPTFHPSLSMAALVTPTYQKDYSVAGMKWPDGFQAIRISIDDTSEDGIKNLD